MILMTKFALAFRSSHFVSNFFSLLKLLCLPAYILRLFSMPLSPVALNFNNFFVSFLNSCQIEIRLLGDIDVH